MLYDIGIIGFHVPMGSKNALQCPHSRKHQKGRKRAETARNCSALPCNVSVRWLNVAALIPATKSGEAYLPDLVGASQLSSSVCSFANSPNFRPLGVVRVLAWVRPSNRNTGRFWRSTAVIHSASPRGISPCRRASRSSTRYRRDRSR